MHLTHPNLQMLSIQIKIEKLSAQKRLITIIVCYPFVSVQWKVFGFSVKFARDTHPLFIKPTQNQKILQLRSLIAYKLYNAGI